MIQMSISIKQKQTDRYRKQTWDCQGGWGWEWGKEELGVWDQQMQTLYIGWINNKVLLYRHQGSPLYSTGNYSQYPVINHNRKE